MIWEKVHGHRALMGGSAVNVANMSDKLMKGKQSRKLPSLIALRALALYEPVAI